jgi:uncharacterized protein (DUF1810 family)/serine/threonine protein kinase
MTSPTVTSVHVMRANTTAPSGSRRDSPVKTLEDFETMIRAAKKGSTIAGRVVLDVRGKEYAIQLYIRDPQRNLVKSLWDFARGGHIERRGNAKRAVERLLARFEVEPGASESVRQIRAQMDGKGALKATVELTKAVSRLAAGNAAAADCIKDFVSLKPRDAKALKAALGSPDASKTQIDDLDSLTLTAMQGYVSNRLAAQFHNKVALNPKSLVALDLKTESAKLDSLKSNELEHVARFARKWLDAYHANPGLVPNNPDPADSSVQLPTWQSEVHDIVLAFAKAHPDSMDEVIGARHTPDSLKLAEFRECAVLFGLPLPKGELKRELPARLNQLGTALQKEICENPDIRLLFETSDPKAFKQYLFREFIAKMGRPVNPDGKPQVAAPLSITFLQFCRRAGAAADYLYLDVLSKMPDRLELDYAHEKDRLLGLMDAGKRAPSEKRIKDDVRRVDVHAKGFTLGDVKYTKVPDGEGMHQFTIFKDKNNNRVAARTIPKTIDAKPNPEYEKQLAAFRSGARIHSQLSAAGDNAATKSLGIIPGPNGELLHVVEFTHSGLADTAVDDLTPGQRRPNRLNNIRLAFIDAVEAVASVHEQNLIHQGLSEDNFGMVLREGGSRYVLTSFDSAATGKAHKIFEPRAASFDYAAPEMVLLQYKNEHGSSHRLPDLLTTQKADMWALGVMLYKMHVGYAPFKDLTGAELKASHLTPYERIRFNQEQLAAMPEQVSAIVRALLSRDPAVRPTAEQLLALPYFDRKKTIPAAALTGGAALQRKLSDPAEVETDNSSDEDVPAQATTGTRKASYRSFDQSFDDSHVREEANPGLPERRSNIDGNEDSDTLVGEESDDQVVGTDAEESSTGESSSESTAYRTTRIAPDADEVSGGTTRLLSPATGGAPGGDFAAAVNRAQDHIDGFKQPEPGLGKQPRQFTRITTDRNDVFTRATTTTATTATRATTATTAAKDPYDLKRFVDAQKLVIDNVRKELKAGHKHTDWMWYVFPQVAGLGLTENSKKYAISSLDEAKAYLADPVLGARLVECCNLMYKAIGDSALAILGSPGDTEFHACLTLFSRLGDRNTIFAKCLEKYFDGNVHRGTMRFGS